MSEVKQLTPITRLYTLYPFAKKGIFEVLDQQLDKYGFNLIDKENFLAQCAHESAGFKSLSENLNYSAQNLLRVFGKYFKGKDVDFYAKNPERIANLVYANRMGNGSEQSGDGYKYRGRGIIQITGKTNYGNCSGFVGVDCITNPEYLETVDGAVKSAIWFWKSRGINGNMSNEQITMKINGGLNGLQDRIAQLNAIRKYLRTAH